MSRTAHIAEDREIYKFLLSPFLSELNIDQLYPSPIPRVKADGSVVHDANPSFKLYSQQTGGKEEIFWKDFGLQGVQRGYRPIDLAIHLWDVSFAEAIYRLETEFNYVHGMRGDFTPKPKQPSGVRVSAPDHIDRLWWQQYGVSQSTLEKYDVYKLVALYHDSEIIKIPPEGKVGFCYVFDWDAKSWQAYIPEPKFFFTKNLTGQLMGYNQLPWEGKDLIICSGVKDGLVTYEAGFPFVAGSGEGASATLMALLPALMRRFERVWSCMDQDYAGYTAMQQIYEKTGIKPLHLPLKPHAAKPGYCKDNADYAFSYGINYLSLLLNQEITKHAQET